MQIDLAAIDGAIAYEEGLPQLGVPAVTSCVNANVPEEDRDNAWRRVVTQWLDLMAETLGAPYGVLDSDQIVLLSALSERQADLLLGSAAQSFERVAEFLGPESVLDWVPVLAFADRDHYYDYVSPFYPDGGHFADSVGFCLAEGLLHVILAPSDLLDLEITAAHEITHAHLNAFSVPAWVDEGLAMIAMEPFGSLPPTQDLDELRTCWQQHGLETFWAGDAFHLPDDRSRFAYDLAYLLVRSLVLRDRPAFSSFLRGADRRDAGYAACRLAYGVAPDELVRGFVGG